MEDFILENPKLFCVTPFRCQHVPPGWAPMLKKIVKFILLQNNLDFCWADGLGIITAARQMIVPEYITLDYLLLSFNS